MDKEVAGSWNRKLRHHKQEIHKQAVGRERGRGYEPSKPTPTDVSSNKAAPPKGPITS